MVSQKVTITNKSGIHARPAGELAKVAKDCKSDTLLLIDTKIINIKSILNLMAAAIRQGTEVTIQCDGEGEEEDLKKIIDAINSGLGE
ncbi:MAG: HPr family phosphocarrier protein [Herbinix sp.]|jgi:phosphocarrier protein|nr:HPr family phosphocarrier protein [Herbinix sp.]